MSLYEAFGIGKIMEYDSYREATDYVIQNSVIPEDSTSSVQWVSDHPTIKEFLDKNYKIQKIEFSIKSRYGTPYDYAYLSREILIAVVTMVENYPHIFISQHLKRELKEKNMSIVRCHPNWWAYSLNTKTSFFEVPRLKRPEKEIITFYRDYWRYSSEFICDYILEKDKIALFPDSYSWRTIGTFKRPMTIDEYFMKNFEEKPLPFQEMGIYNGFWSGRNILAAYRETERGKEVFITREGYSFLTKNNLAVIRARRRTDKDDGWEELDVIFNPEVWK